MLFKRVIPCLDVTGGRVVKGVNFVGLRDAGDPVDVAARYNEQGADELTFLDITATSDDRGMLLHMIEAVAAQVFIPLTVGGGVRSVDDVRRLLNAGADKVSFNSAAVANPDVIAAASARYGAQCIVVAIDAKRRDGGWDVYTHGGRRNTGLDAVQWAQRMAEAGAGEILLTSMDRDGTKAGFDLELTRAVADPRVIEQASARYGAQCIVVAIDAKRREGGGWDVYTHGGRRNTGIDAVQWAQRMAAAGAGEILLTSMDRDGTKAGFDLALTRAVADAVPVPVIASGGVGSLQHLADGIRLGGADAVLAASIFHYGEHTVGEAKRFMAGQGIAMRLDG